MRNSKSRIRSNQSMLTEDEESMIRKMTHSYLAQRVDAFLFEHPIGEKLSKKEDSRFYTGEKSPQSEDPGHKKRYQAEETLNKRNALNHSFGKEGRSKQSQLILISKKNLSKHSMSRSGMTNASSITGKTFIDAEVAKDYLKTVIGENIKVLNRSRQSFLHSESAVELGSDKKGQIRTSTIMSLENFVKNCVNNWLDDVVDSGQEEEARAKYPHEISNLTETFSENLFASKRPKTNSQSVSHGNTRSAIRRMTSAQELRSFTQSRDQFHSLIGQVKEESDILLSDQNSNNFSSNESVPKLYSNREKIAKSGTPKDSEVESMRRSTQKTAEVFHIINTAQNNRESMDPSIYRKATGVNFLESIDEGQLLSRKVTRKHRMGLTGGSSVEEKKIIFSDLQNHSVSQSSFHLPHSVSKNVLHSEARLSDLQSRLQRSIYLREGSKMRVSFENQEGDVSNEIIERNEESYYFYDLGLVGSNWIEYKGEYKDQRKHGYGVWLLGNGEMFEGTFEHGKANGRGKYTSKSGEVLVGIWKMNVLQHDESHQILLPDSKAE